VRRARGLAGTVIDQTRQLVPGATVTLVNEQIRW